jgi:hypothetical protein
MIFKSIKWTSFKIWGYKKDWQRNTGKTGIIDDEKSSEFDIGAGSWKYCTTC